MYYISFDQASGLTGYSIFEETKLIDYGKFKTKETQEYAGKIKETSDFIVDKIKEYSGKGSVIISIEDIQLQENVETFKKLAQLQGVIIADLDRAGFEADFISASTWKSYAKVRGRGRVEQKRNAQKIVTELFGIKATQDESDAILIGYYKCNQGFNWG